MHKLILLCLVPFSLFAQVTDSNRRSFRDSLIESRIGKPIQIHYNLKSVSAEVINFPVTEADVFLYFGFYGCIPCMSELPLFFQLANSFPDKKFIYVTFNSKEYRQREFDEILGQDYIFSSNIKIVELTQSEIDKMELITGFPTRVYVKKGGEVVYYGFGGKVLKSYEKESWLGFYTKILKTGIYNYDN